MRNPNSKLRLIVLAALFVSCVPTVRPAPVGLVINTPAADLGRLSILSAFYGLDDRIPQNPICPQAAAMDGMPLVLSRTINPYTLEASDFAVVTRGGTRHTPVCATIAPAIGKSKNRTVLLFGQFGSANDDPPVRVEIVGSLKTDSSPAEDFKGVSTDSVIPLEAGPTLILAQVIPPAEQRLGTTVRGAGCPVQTRQVVRVTWTGGVVPPDRRETSEAVRQRYRVTVRPASGDPLEVTPFAVADLEDNDNNHDLCLDVAGTPTAVRAEANAFADPNRDLNPTTEVSVTAPVDGSALVGREGSSCMAYFAATANPSKTAADWCASGRYFTWYSTLPENHARASLVFSMCEGEAKKPLIVMVHGFPTSSFDFRKLFAALSNNYYVCALDTPGYGFSDKLADGYRYLIEDDARLLDFYLRNVLQATEVTLLAHDKGDSVALAFLEQRQPPYRLKHLFLTNGNVYLPLANLTSFQKMLLDPNTGARVAASIGPRQLAAGLGQTAFSPALGADGEEVKALETIFAYQSGTRVMNETVKYLSERERLETTWLANLAHSRVPTTLVWGAQDAIAPIAVAEHVWKTALVPRGVSGEFWWLPCANHYPQFDQTEQLARIVDSRLNDRTFTPPIDACAPQPVGRTP